MATWDSVSCRIGGGDGSGAVSVDSERTRLARPRPDRRGSYAERLNYLFATIHPADAGPWSAAEVARCINDSGGKISSEYILKLLRGERGEPNPRITEQLTNFFGVSPTFFTDNDPGELDGPALDYQIRVRGIAHRNAMYTMLARASRLSPGSQAALSDIIDGLLRAEGKKP
jgi:hypothetical protein